jgi:hypothetical protein
MLDYIHFPPYTEEPSKTEQGQFVWAGQKKIRYKQSSGILIPAPIQIIPLGLAVFSGITKSGISRLLLLIIITTILKDKCLVGVQSL